MKIEVSSVIIDFDNVYLSPREAKQLILEINESRCEDNFTLGLIKTLVDTLIKSGDSNKEEIIKHLFD